MLTVPRAKLFHPGVKAMLDGVPAFLLPPASDRHPKHQRRLQNGEPLAYTMNLFAIISGDKTAPALLRRPDSLFCLLLVACKPFNPFTACGSVVRLVSLFECVGVLLPVLVLMVRY